MRTSIQSAPQTVSVHAELEMLTSITDLCNRILKEGKSTRNIPPCQLPVKIGVFFDGTNNNRFRDEPLGCHTNVVKLFKAHKDVEGIGALQESGHYRIYVPGLGTRFPENKEWRESTDGKAFGKGGQARILFALLEVYNAVYRAFNNEVAKFSRGEITAQLQQYTREVDTNDPLRDAHDPRPDRRSWFGRLTEQLTADLVDARKARYLPIIPKITLNVFGFSRGAVQARAFCCWFSDVLKDGKFAGIPAEIGFLGLFDSVASIGLANSAAETTLVFNADGHYSWAAEIRKPLPACVRQTVHYIAAHEQRRNFPITRVTGSDVSEFLYPGVHADVGGGYSPGDQGRGRTMGEMLSQIPLLHMHKAASAAGVPLQAYCNLPSDLQEDYDITPALSAAWNGYMKVGNFAQFEGNYDGMVQAHMRLYYGFRRRWLHDIHYLSSNARASAQDKEDLASYNNLLKGDLAVLRRRVIFARQGGVDVHGRRSLDLTTEEMQNANRWQRIFAHYGVPPGKEELWALAQFDAASELRDDSYLSLLENQIHDSLAGFYLVGYLTAEEKAEALLEIVREGKAPTTPYRKQLWDNYHNAAKDDPSVGAMIQSRIDAYRQAENAPGYPVEKIRAMETARQQTPFSAEEQARLASFFPLQTDASVAELHPFILRTQTETRREGSGYLRPRAVFD